MTIFWEVDAQVVDNVTMALGPTLRSVDAGPLASRAVLEDRATNLLVVGPGIPLSPALGITEELRRERPEVGVVLMRQRLDVALLGQASRAGVREVVDSDDLNALAEACRRSRELSERLGAADSGTADGRVVTVFSAKGGCGKTTVSTNIAAQLAASGTRTLLVDLDLAFGDDAIALGLAPERTMADVVPMSGHVDGPGLASVVTRHGSKLDVLCAPLHPGDADKVPAALVGELLRVAKREYEVVVVDTPPFFDEHVIVAFDISDVSLVLATLDIPSVKNLRLALDTLDLLGHPRELRRVVLNRADAKTGLSVTDVASAIHHDVDARIPESADVTQATNRGVPLVLHKTRHAFSTAIRDLITEAVLPRSSAAAPAEGKRKAEAEKTQKTGGLRLRRRAVEVGVES